MDDCVERKINEFPMKISKSYTVLNISEDNLLEKGNRKSLGKK